jgi:hypothetical protein
VHTIATEPRRLFGPSIAEVTEVDDSRGVIAAGKLADRVIVDGDPTRDNVDIAKVAAVITGGRIHDPAAIETALGIAPH